MSDPELPKFVRLFRLRDLGCEAESLEEIIEALELAAGELKRMLRTGKVWLVPDTAADDGAELGTDSAGVADRFGFEDAKTRAGTEDDPEDYGGDLDDLVSE